MIIRSLEDEASQKSEKEGGKADNHPYHIASYSLIINQTQSLSVIIIKFRVGLRFSDYNHY